MKIASISLAVAVVCVLCLPGTVRGGGQYSVDYPASAIDGELRIAVSTLWIPDG
jgi:hypothetical protein